MCAPAADTRDDLKQRSETAVRLKADTTWYVGSGFSRTEDHNSRNTIIGSTRRYTIMKNAPGKPRFSPRALWALRLLSWALDQSSRNTIIGSTRVADRAGT